MEICRNSKTSNDNSPNLDRINSQKGYVKDNVIFISKKANQIKSNGNLAEHELICKFLRKHKA